MFRRAVVGAVLVIASMAVLATPATAQYLENAVVPGSAVAGSDVTVTGSGCAPFQDITITVYPSTASTLAGVPDSTPILTINTTSDGEGNYTVSFTVPDGLAPGWYDVLGPCPPRTGPEVNIDRANRADERLYLIGRFLIVAPGDGNGNGNNGGGVDLPRTGSDLNGLGLIGAGLLTAGGLILVATTSRRRRPAAA